MKDLKWSTKVITRRWSLRRFLPFMVRGQLINPTITNAVYRKGILRSGEIDPQGHAKDAVKRIIEKLLKGL